MSNPTWQAAAERRLLACSEPVQNTMLAWKNLVIALTAFQQSDDWGDALWLLRTSGEKIILAERKEYDHKIICILDSTGFQVQIKMSFVRDSHLKFGGMYISATVLEFAEQIILSIPPGERNDLTMDYIHTCIDEIAAATPQPLPV